MYQVTLDTNCLLDLEKGGERADAVGDLVARHHAGSIALRIPAIAASERQRSGTELQNFSEFTDWLARLGLGPIPLILPMLYFDVGFWDHCLWSDQEMQVLERKIHDILHPEIELEYQTYCKARGIDPIAKPLDGKWRNVKCDVQVMWSHVHHRGKTLVTNDENFLKATKLPRLLALGAGAIVRTIDAPAQLDRVV